MKRMQFVLFGVLMLMLAACLPFPSTNAANELAGRPYVEVISINGCQITLGFHNPKNYGAGFEVSEDGVTATSGTPQPLFGNSKYPYITWEYFTNDFFLPGNSYVEHTYTAQSFVVVAHSHGAERDNDFIEMFATYGCTPPSGGSGSSGPDDSLCGIVSADSAVGYYGQPNLPITFYGRGTACSVVVRHVDGGPWVNVILADVQLSEDQSYWTGLVGFSGPGGALVERGSYCMQMVGTGGCIMIEVQ